MMVVVVAEKQVFSPACWRVHPGGAGGHRRPYSCRPASPPLSCGRPAASHLPPSLLCSSSSSSSSWAFDQSWPLCHGRPSGGSSPSPTTTVPAGRPSPMNTCGCKHPGANPRTHTRTDGRNPRQEKKGEILMRKRRL